jgi:hypothetical protein
MSGGSPDRPRSCVIAHDGGRTPTQAHTIRGTPPVPQPLLCGLVVSDLRGDVELIEPGDF